MKISDAVFDFEQVYRDNYIKVCYFIYRIATDWSLAEDIAQDAFVKAYKNIDSLRDGLKISAWLNKIAYNLYLDFKKKKTSYYPPIDDNLTAELVDLEITPFKKIEQNIMSECVHNKILLIPESYRVPLLLDMYGYNNKEIANISCCSLENAKIRLHRARIKMKEIMSKDCVFYYDERSILC
ncbi:MAG: RNA polymerase sigma factor [Firmicutes bacterium]|nr:RNA polymerase sigma factor [Bacillota bacterium]